MMDLTSRICGYTRTSLMGTASLGHVPHVFHKVGTIIVEKMCAFGYTLEHTNFVILWTNSADTNYEWHLKQISKNYWGIFQVIRRNMCLSHQTSRISTVALCLNG